jgi:hypothetical protein
MARFQAQVHKKTTHHTGALNSAARPLLVGPDGKELPKDDQGKYVGSGTQKIESTVTIAVDDPLTDEAGNTVEAGTVDALLRKVKEYFGREEHENVEVQRVVVQEIKTVQEVSGEELRKL